MFSSSSLADRNAFEVFSFFLMTHTLEEHSTEAVGIIFAHFKVYIQEIRSVNTPARASILDAAEMLSTTDTGNVNFGKQTKKFNQLESVRNYHSRIRNKYLIKNLFQNWNSWMQY